LLDVLGRGKIGKALAQIDRAEFHRFARHLADDRFGKARGFSRDAGF